MKVGFPVIDVAVGMLGALSIVAAVHRRSREGVGQYIDASMVQAALMLMYPNASGFLTSRIEPQRVGNRGYTGSPTADTYRCTDGWLATAANTPAQFRKLVGVLGMEALCDDAAALDLGAFNAPGGGFVVARDLPAMQQLFREAFAQRSASDMESRLNAVGVPAARVRRLGEFLDEAEAGTALAMTPVGYANGATPVRTPGLGFSYRFDGTPRATGAPALGQDGPALLAELGFDLAAVQALRHAGVIHHP